MTDHNPVATFKAVCGLRGKQPLLRDACSASHVTKPSGRGVAIEASAGDTSKKMLKQQQCVLECNTSHILLGP